MKVTLLTKEFSKTLSISSRFVATRANLPVLSNVVLKAQKSKLTLCATDLELSIVIDLGAHIYEDGEIAVPAKTLYEIISNLSGSDVTLHTEGEILHIESEGFKSFINGVNTSDYPTLPTSVSDRALTVSAATLIPSLNKVLFACSTDEARPVFTGMLFLFNEQKCNLVATDGFRLSQKSFDCTHELVNKKFIVPKRVLTEIPKLSGSSNILIDFDEANNQVVFSLPKIVVSSRLIDGEFPNYERIIPRAHNVSINASKDDIARAVKLSSVFARDNANTITLAIENNKIRISAQSNKSGEGSQEIDANVEGQNVEILLNFRFLEEAIEVVSGESVEIKLNDATTPCVVLDPKDNNFLHLIQPVRN